MIDDCLQPYFLSVLMMQNKFHNCGYCDFGFVIQGLLKKVVY